jgi:hypothetical protein
MTLDDLIRRLTDIRDGHKGGPEFEVKLRDLVTRNDGEVGHIELDRGFSMKNGEYLRSPHVVIHREPK